MHILCKKPIFALCLTILRPLIVSTTQLKMSNKPDVPSGSTMADVYSIAYVTTPSLDVGKGLAYGLLENKLAACVNIVPKVLSVYEWKGVINEDTEAMLIIKTKTSHIDQVTDYVRTNHPYEVCEVISMPIKNGNSLYLEWIGDKIPADTRF